jgi:hypothetical protein
MASRPASKIAGSGFPVVTAFLPDAVSIAATIEPVPGQSPSGIGTVGSCPVAISGAPARAAMAAALSSS